MKKRMISLLLAAVMVLSVAPMAGAARFTDVKTTDWYYGYVRDLADAGIINGMTETTYVPNGTLTYGQALKLIALTAGKSERPTNNAHWAGGYLTLAKEEGWMTGDVDLNSSISRLRFCQITAKSQNLTRQSASNPFKDTADPDVLALVNAGVINGMSANMFVPDGHLTRAQIAKIIWCIKNPGKTPTPPTAEEIAADKVHVTAVKILETLTMEVGTSQRFTVNVEPSNATDKTITWTAGNPGVATIDKDGVITAHKAGQCHITAMASNGVKAVCLVTVKEKNPITAIEVDKTLSIKVGESDYLNPIVTPYEAENYTLRWTAGNPSVATVDENGTIFAHKAGNCHITVTTNNGLKATCLVTVWDNMPNGYCGAEGDGSNLTWKIDVAAKTLTISGKGRMADFSQLSSAWYGTMSDAPWISFLNAQETPVIDTILINDGVTNIGNNAFAYLYSEFSSGPTGTFAVLMADSVTEIGDRAFESSGLSGLALSKNLKKVWSLSFANTAFQTPKGVEVVQSPEYDWGW